MNKTKIFNPFNGILLLALILFVFSNYQGCLINHNRMVTKAKFVKSVYYSQTGHMLVGEFFVGGKKYRADSYSHFRNISFVKLQKVSITCVYYKNQPSICFLILSPNNFKKFDVPFDDSAKYVYGLVSN